MMAVYITTEPVFTPGTPRFLFEGQWAQSAPVRSYDVAPDGQRFLMLEVVEQPVQTVRQLHVVLNWFEELKRLVPTDN
jgi:hypothetical protein